MWVVLFRGSVLVDGTLMSAIEARFAYYGDGYCDEFRVWRIMVLDLGNFCIWKYLVKVLNKVEENYDLFFKENVVVDFFFCFWVDVGVGSGWFGWGSIEVV